MAKQAICMPCGMEFPSEASFQQHKDSGHTTKGGLLMPPSAVPSPEFMETVQRLEAQALTPTVPLADPTKAPDGSELKLPEAKPIVLTYVYTGDCPTCIKPISTLELNVKDSHFVVAYCEICKKQLNEREERDLGK